MPAYDIQRDSSCSASMVAWSNSWYDLHGVAFHISDLAFGFLTEAGYDSIQFRDELRLGVLFGY